MFQYILFEQNRWVSSKIRIKFFSFSFILSALIFLSFIHAIIFMHMTRPNFHAYVHTYNLLSNLLTKRLFNINANTIKLISVARKPRLHCKLPQGSLMPLIRMLWSPMLPPTYSIKQAPTPPSILTPTQPTAMLPLAHASPWSVADNSIFFDFIQLHKLLVAKT